MALIQIPVLAADEYPTAAINPALAVTISRSASARRTTITLNAPDPQPATPHSLQPRVRTLLSPAPLLDILAALAAAGVQLVPVDRNTSTPIHCHVNSDAIISVQPMSTGNGHIWLTNGESLFVTPAGLQSMAALLIAPSAAVAAGKI